MGLLLLCIGCGPQSNSAPVVLQDLTGAAHTPERAGPSDPRHGVVVFVSADCPIANRQAPTLGELFSEFGEDFRCYIVHCVPQSDEPESIRRGVQTHTQEYGLSAATVLLDRGLALAQRLGAVATPEAFVLGPTGSIMYRGRIDNLYAALGERRHEPTRHELRDALRALRAGDVVDVEATEVVGCPLPRQPQGRDE